ncbi:Helix-turn-helix domain, partial [Dysosmobacter welbionis]
RHHRLPGGKRLHLSRGDGRDGHALLPVRHQRLSHHIHDRHGGQRLRLRPGRRQPGGHGRHRGADQDRAAQ